MNVDEITPIIILNSLYRMDVDKGSNCALLV